MSRSSISLFRPLCALALLVLAGCASKTATTPESRPADIRAQLLKLLPDNVKDRQGWATDIATAFTTQGSIPVMKICARCSR